ncbi:MAG: Gfo/Idh/MocA family oxidoreductase [bacterium]
MAKWRIAGINFDHMHMVANLRMAYEHPDAEVVGLCDEHPQRMQPAADEFNIPGTRLFTDYEECLEKTCPDIVLLCPATAQHGAWTEKVAPYGAHMIMEKPFAASLPEADRMIRATQAAGKLLAINWPLAWYPPHVTTKRLIDEGVIGGVIEVHYYDGNRGPVSDAVDKVKMDTAAVLGEKSKSWFYKKEQGGGSLLDYLGYGVTLGTWFHGEKSPVEVSCVVYKPEGLEVDEHSITIARYEKGLSKFETRWGTFTHPWIHQPQPKCGFVIMGTEGTIGSYDYESTIRVQTRSHPEGEIIPVDIPQPPLQNPVQYIIHCLEENQPIQGPLSPGLCRIGQQIVDTAIQSAEEKRSLPLIQ